MSHFAQGGGHSDSVLFVLRRRDESRGRISHNVGFRRRMFGSRPYLYPLDIFSEVHQTRTLSSSKSSVHRPTSSAGRTCLLSRGVLFPEAEAKVQAEPDATVTVIPFLASTQSRSEFP